MKYCATLIVGLGLFVIPAYAQTEAPKLEGAVSEAGPAEAKAGPLAGTPPGDNAAVAAESVSPRPVTAGEDKSATAAAEAVKPKAPETAETAAPAAEKKEAASESPSAPDKGTASAAAKPAEEPVGKTGEKAAEQAGTAAKEPTASTGATGETATGTPPGDNKAAVKKAPAEKKSARTSTGSLAVTNETEKKPAKKTVNKNPRASGVAVTKEGGRTCSGRDEYRVCW